MLCENVSRRDFVEILLEASEDGYDVSALPRSAMALLYLSLSRGESFSVSSSCADFSIPIRHKVKESLLLRRGNASTRR